MIDRNKALAHIRDFDFTTLFIDELGWDHCTNSLAVPVAGVVYPFTAIAQKRGMVLYHCALPAGAGLPDSALRSQLERQVVKTTHENIIVFTDAARTRQHWLWVKREPGKPAEPKGYLFTSGQSGEALLLRLQSLAFTLAEEEKTTLSDVANRARAAFDVEKVTKKFYTDLAGKRAGFEKFLTWVDGEKDRSWYLTALLNRMMFIYFIQHKGLMQDDQHYLRHLLEQCIAEGRNFYRTAFLPLCFFGFARPAAERGDFTMAFDGVPYLNGGLFLPHQVEQQHGITPEAVGDATLPAAITIPNEQFTKWFDFFDTYTWTLDDVHPDNDRHINPDVLGYIFEKYINQKQMGAYYTKEDITGYICRNTIIPRLFDMLAATGKKGAQAVAPLPIGPHPSILNDGQGISNGAGIDRYIYHAVKTQELLPTETEREYQARQARYDSILRDFDDGKITTINDFITCNLDIELLAKDFIGSIQDAEVLRSFYFDALRKITVLDPTCGSGAFLFAALKLLSPLYAACVQRMEKFYQTEASHAPIAVTWKDEFAFANDVSQQLGFIDTPADGRQAILDQFAAELSSIRAHGNVEYFIYKRIIVDNLFGVDIMPEAVEICKLRLFLKLIAHAEKKPGAINMGIEPLPDVDFNILCGNTLVGFATRAEVDAHFANGLGLVFAGQKLLDDLIPKMERFALDTLAGDHDDALKREISELKTAVATSLTAEEITRRNWKKGVPAFEQSHQPFHWLVEYPRVMAGGGFDAIVGNPPYVEYSKVKKDYKVIGYSTEECGNLYAYVTERCTVLIAKSGYFSFIIPAASCCTPRMESLMNTLYLRYNSHWISIYDERPSKLFDGVDQQLSIHLCAGNGVTSYRFITPMRHWASEERSILFSTLHLQPVPPEMRIADVTPKIGSSIEEIIAEKLLSHRSNTIGDYEENAHGLPIYYRNAGGRYWRLAKSFSTSFITDSGRTSSTTECILNVKRKFLGLILCLMASTTFYWYWRVASNCRHLTRRELLVFPIPDTLIDTGILGELDQLKSKFEAGLNESKIERCTNSRHSGSTVHDEYHVNSTKPIIDEIDKVLAQHYGFTDEELDFIINYDIKYRMGRDAEEE